MLQATRHDAPARKMGELPEKEAPSGIIRAKPSMTVALSLRCDDRSARGPLGGRWWDPMPERSTTTRPPLSLALSPSSRAMRARKRSKTIECVAPSAGPARITRPLSPARQHTRIFGQSHAGGLPLGASNYAARLRSCSHPQAHPLRRGGVRRATGRRAPPKVRPRNFTLTTEQARTSRTPAHVSHPLAV